MERFKICCAVHAIIIKDNKILLQRRSNKNKHGYGKLGLPAGHLEENENVYEAIKRELKEELNIEIINPKLVQVMNLNGDTDVYDAYFFLCNDYQGNITNNEKNNAKDLEWHDLNFPITDLMDYENYALTKYMEDENNKFTLFGWK